MKKMFSYFLKHKAYILIIILVLGGGGYWANTKWFSNAETVRYVTAKVERGVLTSTTSGSGQVLPLSQVDIKSKASGNIIFLPVINGQIVKEGTILAKIDSQSSALKVSQAKVSLDEANLALSKLLAPADAITLLQAENGLLNAKDSLEKTKLSQEIKYQQTLEAKQKAEDNLKKTYEDSYNAVSNVFLDLPDVMSAVYSVISGAEISKTEATVSRGSTNNVALSNSILSSNWQDVDKFQDFLSKAKSSYNSAKTDYDVSFNAYKETNRNANNEVIESLLDKALETTKKISDVVKNQTNLLGFWVEYRNTHNLPVFTQVTAFQASLSGYTSLTAGHLSSLLSSQRSLLDYKESILNAERDLKQMEHNNPVEIAQLERSIGEQEAKLADLKTGPEAVDVESQKLTIEQRKNDLWSAQQDLADHFVRAPFDGVIVSLTAKRGDIVGANGAITSIITSQKIAQITLNEIDVAKVKLGQKANLTFDAVGDLNITGVVAEIDTLGAVSQGVVSYNVKIAFDVQDERVKPNMSVSASIILNSKPDVLMVPSMAVKNQNGASYVELFVNNAPEKKDVQVGASNDTMTEIISGLNEGDEVVTQTISASNVISPQTSNTSRQGGGMRIPGMF